jgi:hypothetical protein
MKLHPRRPPGRVDRKAAAYASDIAELRGAGYTYEAIREALLDVGVVASTSALRREFHRQRTRDLRSSLRTAPGPPEPCAPPTARPSLPPAQDPPQHLVAGGMSGRDVAESFFNAHPSNSLLKSQEVP